MIQYRIEIEEELTADRSFWFDDCTVEINDERHSILSGEIEDQTALHGILNKIRDLRLTLISVQIENTGETTA